MQIQTKQAGIFAAMILLMGITRTSHFGSTIHLPDATLAIFLIAGFMLPRYTWAALAVFALLLLEAGGIDYYAIAYRGVSDYCVSPAYWFLLPTYASMWLGGRWFAAQQQNNLRSLALFTGVSWLATTIAFMISNGSFYLLSGRFTEMSVMEYTARVAKYYPPYLSSSLMYLAFAAVIYVALNQLNKTSSSTQH
ncbi:MAG: hypothetical protein ACOH1I_07975 [Gallionellaceae bacterium]|jgi:hypothetical protein